MQDAGQVDAATLNRFNAQASPPTFLNDVDRRLERALLRSPADPESDVTVQVPNIRRISDGTRTRLQVGESLMIAIPRTFRDHARGAPPPTKFYLFTPRLLDDSDALSSYVRDAAVPHAPRVNPQGP